MGVHGVGLHLCGIEDGAIGSDEGDGERQRRILHPEAVPVCLFEYEQHAAIGAKMMALH